MLLLLPLALLLALCRPASAQQWYHPGPIFFCNGDGGFWFNAEALYMSHNQDAHSIPVIDGPEGFRLGDDNLDWQPGTRMTAGIFEEDYELSGSYLFLSPFSSARGGLLTHALDFDGPLAYFSAIPAARTAVDPTDNPNFITPGTTFSVLNTAANTSGETDALEFLRPGVRFEAEYITEFSDVEVNYAQRELLGRPWRFGLGFRHSRVQENAFAAFSGTFGTVASNGGVPFNNGLSAGSLTGSGLVLLSNAVTNTGFSDAVAAPPAAADQLLLTSGTVTSNQLYGAQVLAEAFLLQTESLSLSFFVKPGVFVNLAKGTITEIYADTLNDKSAYGRLLYDRETSYSFLGNIGATMRYYVWDHVSVSAGYEMFYVTGLALASDQLVAITTPVTGAATLSLRTDNAILIHGGRIGLEIAF